MRPDNHKPPQEYPVCVKPAGTTIPDFSAFIPGGGLGDAEEYIKKNLLMRRDNGMFYPYPSSTMSVQASNPDGVVLMVSTEGWETQRPLEAAAQPEE